MGAGGSAMRVQRHDNVRPQRHDNIRPRRVRGPVRRPVQPDPDRGSASVLALAVVGMVVALLAAGLLIGAVAVAGQSARTAADLAALAAAGRVTTGQSVQEACSVAAEVAQDNGARITGCAVRPAESGAARSGAVGGSGSAVTGARAVPTVEVEVGRAVAGTRWTVRAKAAATGVPQRR